MVHYLPEMTDSSSRRLVGILILALSFTAGNVTGHISIQSPSFPYAHDRRSCARRVGRRARRFPFYLTGVNSTLAVYPRFTVVLSIDRVGVGLA